VGGRIITLHATGETAFVGFGSSIVRMSNNSAVQAKLNLASQKIAAAHSKDALCGLTAGDQTSWRGGVVESLQDEVKEFEVLAKDDPLAKSNPRTTRKLEQARQTLVAQLKTEDLYTSVRKGVLPPGVVTKTWFDDDNAWAYAMSVYIPSVSRAATEAAREMKDARLLPGDPTALPADGERSGKNGGTSGFRDEKNPAIRRPGDAVRPGSSGRVGKDEDK
jgi:hypothetical protein